MKKKHYIETIDDIKYCEEHDIEVYDDYQATVCFRFVDGVWCSYTNKKLNVYNVRLSLNSLYYEEEEEEPMKEATADDVGKLCLFIKENGEEFVAVLESYDTGYNLRFECCCGWYSNCRPLTKEEIKEFMEKAE